MINHNMGGEVHLQIPKAHFGITIAEGTCLGI